MYAITANYTYKATLTLPTQTALCCKQDASYPLTKKPSRAGCTIKYNLHVTGVLRLEIARVKKTPTTNAVLHHVNFILSIMHQQKTLTKTLTLLARQHFLVLTGFWHLLCLIGFLLTWLPFFVTGLPMNVKKVHVSHTKKYFIKYKNIKNKYYVSWVNTLHNFHYILEANNWYMYHHLHSEACSTQTIFLRLSQVAKHLNEHTYFRVEIMYIFCDFLCEHFFRSAAPSAAAAIAVVAVTRRVNPPVQLTETH